MVQTVKKGLKAYAPSKGPFDAYLSRLLLSYRSIPHAACTESPSALMGHQIRSPLTMSFCIDAPIWYVPKSGSEPVKGNFIMQQGSNMALVTLKPGNRAILAHHDQIKEVPEGNNDDDNNKHKQEEQEMNRPIAYSNTDEMDDTVVTQPGSPMVAENRRSMRTNFGVPPSRFRFGGSV